MPDVSVGMAVTGIAQFKQGMKESENAVKSLDAALKLNESQMKLNGDAETYMSQKVTLLNRKIEEQKNVVKQAEGALKALKEKGVSTTSGAFQDMQRKMLNAQTALTDMQTELKNVQTESGKADESLQGIGKNVAWSNVADGLGKITDKLESAGRAAVKVAKSIAKSAMGSTGWADDILTRATQYGTDAETIQRMDKVAAYIDTDVDTILAAQDRLAKSSTQKDIGELLGISTEGKSVDQLFWEVGDAIMALGEGFDKTEISQKIFGKSWRELLPLFTAGEEEYKSMLESQEVLTQEQIENLGKADDAFKQIEQQIEMMKNQFWADNADKITELLQWLINNADGVKAALVTIGAGFGALKLAEAAANIGKVVSGLKSLGFLGGGGASAAGQALSGGAGQALTGGAEAAAGGGFLKALAAKIGTIVAELGPTMAVTMAAITPALIAQGQDYARSEEKRQSRQKSAEGLNTPEAQFLKAAADALVLRQGENKDFSGIENLLMGLQGRQNQQKAELYNIIDTYAPETGNGQFTWNLLNKFWESGGGLEAADADALLEAITTAFQAKIDADNAPKIPVEPEVEDGAADQIAAQVGVVTIPTHLQIIDSIQGSHANGLPYVPFDGYHAILHKGERVVTAREAGNSRNFSSNLYVESMYMNNGTDADGLAAAMAAAQRRTMSGYGS